jgi:hypothetical protein
MLVAIVAATLDYLPDAAFGIPPLDLLLYVLGWGSAAIAGARGVMRAGGQPKFLHLFGMVLYWLLQSVAAGKALQQFITAPHHWDKTRHTARATSVFGSRPGPHSGRAGP